MRLARRPFVILAAFLAPVVVDADDRTPPAVRVVFFTPSDLAEPPGVAERLTRVAAAAERFLFDGMKQQGYPAAVDRLFRRTPNGEVEIIRVQGDEPASTPRYQKPAAHIEAIDQARQQAGIKGEGDVWWVFMHIGQNPVRFAEWAGAGDPVGGGWAIVNYDAAPGAIRPEASLTSGFNADFFLKGAIHELGHALGLPHVGPDLTLGLGNSLMGPNNSVDAARKHPHADLVYLTESSAAMLWKHPLLSGSTADRDRRPEGIKLVAWKPTFSRTANQITLNGQVAARPMPHSVIVRDDLGRPQDDYWHVAHVARVAADGTFKLTIDRPVRAADGRYEIEFAFPNGMTTGDGIHLGNDQRGGIKKSFHFRNGAFQFGG